MEIVILVGAVGMVLLIIRHFRMKSALSAEISDDSCVSCGKSNITVLGEGVYRCEECGYQGGSCVAVQHAQARSGRILSMAPAERRQSGIQDMREARTLLLGVQGSLQNALSSSWIDMGGIRRIGGMGDSAESSEKHAAISSAMVEIMRAQQHLKDAALKLGNEDLVVGELNIDFSDASFSLDIQFDNLFFDIKTHGKIKEMQSYAERMLEATQRALSKLE